MSLLVTAGCVREEPCEGMKSKTPAGTIFYRNRRVSENSPLRHSCQPARPGNSNDVRKVRQVCFHPRPLICLPGVIGHNT